MPTYHILTFGCQMNVNDSIWLGRALESHGFQEAPLESADVICINTCSVREKPEQKVVNTIHRIKQLTLANPKTLVGVLGCVAQQLGAKLFKVTPQVRLVAGPDALAMLPKTIEQLLDESSLHISLLDFTSTYLEREDENAAPIGPCAYVNIMQGCDNFCTYCIVPYTRGRQKSRPLPAILAECARKIELGARELTLLGQNVNAYGQDKAGDGTRFAKLLEQVAALPNLERIRYTSPHPKDMRPEDVEAFGSIAKLCPSLHLPLQSGSTRILKRMARGYSREEYAKLVSDLKNVLPSISLTTDIIVGFPGETEDDLAETLSMMDFCGYTSSYSFCYSDRPGCKAVNFLDKIAQDVQHERLDQVQQKQDLLTSEWLKTRVGQSTTLLLEEKSPRQPNDGTSWQGRDPFGTIVHLNLDAGANYRGKMLEVTITGCGKHCLHAKQKSSLW